MFVHMEPGDDKTQGSSSSSQDSEVRVSFLYGFCTPDIHVISTKTTLTFLSTSVRALCPYSSFHLKWHFHSFTSNFLIILFGGGYSCFTMFYNKANQLHAHMYPLPLELPSLPTLPAEVITEQRTELPMLCSRFSLAICFTHGSVYMSILVSQFIPLSPSPPPRPTCRFSTSASLFLPCNRFSLGIGLGIPATVIASSVPFF